MDTGAPRLRVVVVVGCEPSPTVPVVQAAANSVIVIRIPKVLRIGLSLAVAPPTQRVAEKFPEEEAIRRSPVEKNPFASNRPQSNGALRTKNEELLARRASYSLSALSSS